MGDNIIYPGSPDYLAFFKQSELYDSTLYHSFLEYSDTPDAVLVSERIAEWSINAINSLRSYIIRKYHYSEAAATYMLFNDSEIFTSSSIGYSSGWEFSSLQICVFRLTISKSILGAVSSAS